jgi:hypothetical protein
VFAAGHAQPWMPTPVRRLLLLARQAPAPWPGNANPPGASTSQGQSGDWREREGGCDMVGSLLHSIQRNVTSVNEGKCIRGLYPRGQLYLFIGKNHFTPSNNSLYPFYTQIKF